LQYPKGEKNAINLAVILFFSPSASRCQPPRPSS
jgi:hypothetical protein